MPPDLKLLRLVVGLLSLAVMLSALGLSIAAVVAGDHPKWTLFGFEIVAAVAGVLGLLLAFGRMRGAPGLALACVAGSIFIAAVLGYYGASGRLDLRAGRAPILLKPLLLARLAAVGVLGMTSAFLVLRRDPRAVSTFFKGVVWALPLVLLAVGYWFLRATIPTLPGAAKTILALAAGIVAMASIAGAGHLIIHAFEIGSEKGDDASAPRPA